MFIELYPCEHALKEKSHFSFTISNKFWMNMFRAINKSYF